MKGVKQCLKFLPLFAILSLCCLQSLDVNALQHEYVGLQWTPYRIPSGTYDSSTGDKYLNWDWDSTHSLTFFGSSFSVFFQGDALTDYERGLSVPHSFSFIDLRFQDNECYYRSTYPLFNFSESNNVLRFGSNNSFDSSIMYPNWQNLADSSYNCDFEDEFGIGHQPDFVESSLSNTLMSCDFNGNGCGGGPGLIPSNRYVSDNVLPYWFSTNGLFIHSKAIDTDGFHYSHSFSLSDIFNKPIYRFSNLNIPLGTFDDYFLTPSNLYQGRQMEIKGAFAFDGSFSWHDNIENNGSSFKISFQGERLHGSNSNWVNQSVDCTTVFREVQGADYSNLEFSCPFTFNYDYLFITSFTIQIDGNGNYVWETDSDWRFSTLFLTTDNDSTPGYSFNTNVQGGGYIPGDAKNDIASSNGNNIDFFASLKGLFDFSFLNPFRPLFDLFNSNEQCANIPTIAGLIHSNETTVCPWFDSTTRNIATPVFGLASMMIVFGFAVRWLGSRSGNFVEDSGGFDSGGFHIENKFRRRGK